MIEWLCSPEVFDLPNPILARALRLRRAVRLGEPISGHPDFACVAAEFQQRFGPPPRDPTLAPRTGRPPTPRELAQASYKAAPQEDQ